MIYLCDMKLEEEIKQSKFKNERQKLVLNLMFTSSWLGIRQIKFFRNYELSPQQFNVMRILRGQYPKPASINLLMDRMFDKTSNASRLVDKLELKQLVERKKCQSDKRKADVLITDKGLLLLETIDREVSNFENTMLNIEDDEAKKLNELLDKMRS